MMRTVVMLAALVSATQSVCPGSEASVPEERPSTPRPAPSDDVGAPPTAAESTESPPTAAGCDTVQDCLAVIADPSDPRAGEASLRLASLGQALANHPDAESVEQLDAILRALAKVRPMAEEAVALYASTNAQGYAASNAILLAGNASPNALALFETMLMDATFEPEEKVELVHSGLLPVRTEPAVVVLLTRWLARAIPVELEVALVETMFDNQPAQWFGKVREPPTPPPWSAASSSTLTAILALARQSEKRTRLSKALRERVGEAAEAIRAELAAR